jgi:predicted porin
MIEEGLTYDYKKKDVIDIKDNYNKLQMSYSLSANLKYQLTEKLNLFVEPYYNSGINSIWKDSPVYAWKRISYGVFLGVEYLIDK